MSILQLTKSGLASAGKLALLGLVMYPQFDTSISLTHSDSSEVRDLIARCPSLNSGFRPTLWLFNGIFQALYGGFAGSTANTRGNPDFVEYNREEILMPDGGKISIDWKLPPDCADSTKILLIAPGLTGHSGSQYIRTAVLEGVHKGFRVGVMHGRGLGNTQLTSLRVHHICASDDFQFIISQVQSKFPAAHIVGLGTSMGAGLLLKYASETGKECTLKAIATVSTPFDYIITRKILSHWWPYFGFSDQYIVKQLLDQFYFVLPFLEKHSEKLKEKGIDISEIPSIRSSQEFDSKFTIRLYDFDSTEQYYKEASVTNSLNKIEIPVLALSSEDDPVVSSRCIPVAKIQENPKILLAVTRVGGHVGWFTGLAPKRWYARPCLEFLDAALDKFTSL